MYVSYIIYNILDNKLKIKDIQEYIHMYLLQ
jgi:hypothetical protein